MISRARGALNRMIVAVEGCCHGSLSAIYDTIHQYESNKSTKVDLLLICGDFQALRSEHDFPSLAVPPKYYSLGTFHQYYSGAKRAPLLTIVIGGNHEASNYMWELYHGGWLAENIYYLGAAGSVMVNGLRISGASGIYKDGDYHKGRFETVPYNHSTMRSTYHTRKYDITRLMRLPRDVPTLFMSHDWPISIPHYGNVPRLLRTKPFFKQEVETNTLGSPPLLELLDTLQPEYWFAAHLHVKFAAVYPHDQNSLSLGTSVRSGGPGRQGEPPVEEAPAIVVPVANPDEIDIDDDEFDDPPISASNPGQPANEEEIVIDMEDVSPEEAKLDLKVDESVDLVEAARKGSDPSAAENVIGVPESTVSSSAPVSTESITSIGVSSIAGLAVNGGAVEGNSRVTKFLALDKPGGSREFIQFLEIPTPEPLEPGQQPRMTYDPYWLAIVKVYNPYLSLEIRPKVYPLQDHLDQMVKDEYERILHEGLLVPAQAARVDSSSVGQNPGGPTTDSEAAAVAEAKRSEAEAGMDNAEIKLVWEKGPIEINRVQKFWPTAPCQGQPGGDPRAWYTNPQTEAFCGMLGIENKINPPPK